MLKLRKASDRGRADFGWLDSRHTFSFGQYYDPDHVGFRTLRVINDDRVAPSGGFPTHPHRDMEIISYVVDGALEHRDSMGTGSVIRPGDVQRMTAGTGVTHSEFNPSDSDPTRFLQIWILPQRQGLEPGYEQRHFAEPERRDRLRLIASPDGRDGSVRVHRDVRLYGALLEDGTSLTHAFEDGRAGWVQVVNGSVRLGDVEMNEGDGAAIEGLAEVDLVSAGRSELLLFDLA